MPQINLENISIEIEQKNIKNLYLRVSRPLAKVKISAPQKMSLEKIQTFAISKIDWIKKVRTKILSQNWENLITPKLKRGHYFLGKRYSLKTIKIDQKPQVKIEGDFLILTMAPNTNSAQKKLILQEWRRAELKKLLPILIEKWQRIMGVEVKEFSVKKMKTRWGTCNTRDKRIWIAIELSKKSLECIEYVVIHEMVHLLERKHNKRFKSYMDQFLPHWRDLEKELRGIKVD
jgi:predicted metal-dependent hydrolase